MNERCVVHRLSIADRRLESDIFGDVPCFFIEPMAQAIDDADHLDLAAGEEPHLQSDLTLDACFLLPPAYISPLAQR